MGRGLPGYVAIKQSSIVIHTYPEDKVAMLDLHTCGKTNPKIALEDI